MQCNLGVFTSVGSGCIKTQCFYTVIQLRGTDKNDGGQKNGSSNKPDPLKENDEADDEDNL